MKNDLITKPHKRDKATLLRLQKLPLEQKIALSQRRIKQYIEVVGDVYVSFSGGKDSTVLLDMVRKLYPETVGVFSDTGLEWPEIREFVQTVENIVWLKPKMPFTEVVKKYGYPVISKEVAQKVQEIRDTNSEKLLNKRLYGDANGNGKLSKKWQFLIDAPFNISGKCCDVMKKRPMKAYEKQSGRHPIVGTMADESSLRQSQWVKAGCNYFGARAMSAPLSFWTEKDIWEYIHKYNLKYSKIYDMGHERTGCMFCMFGIQFPGAEGCGRFNLMRETHPKQYKYIMEHMKGKEIVDYLNDNLKVKLNIKRD